MSCQLSTLINEAREAKKQQKIQFERLKEQRAALHAGRSTALSWQYAKDDTLTGAICDGQWFGRDELLALSTL